MIRTAVALALVAGAAAGAARLTLVGGVFHASPASAAATLQVFVDGPPDLPPLLGSSSREGDALLFKPRFGLQPGMRYRAVYREPGRPPLVEVIAIAPPDPVAPTAVVRIDPTPDVLPENLLKLYLNFSAPMS